MLATFKASVFRRIKYSADAHSKADLTPGFI